MGDAAITIRQDPIQNRMLPLGGKLYVPPAYIQTSGDQAVPLASANHRTAFSFTSPIDCALSSLSVYKNAVVDADAILTMSLHAWDGSVAWELNGDFNGSMTNSIPTMTANNAPSPYVAQALDSAGANAEAVGFEAYKAFDGSTAVDNGFRSNAAPTALAPIYLCFDAGEGNTFNWNRFAFYSFNNADANVRAFPKAWTIWYSNLANPDEKNDADWTEMLSPHGDTWTAETDPYTEQSRHYTVISPAGGYRHLRFKFTDRNGVNAYMALGSIYGYQEQRPVPGTLLATIATATVGAGAGWLRDTPEEDYQLQRGQRYWICFAGQAAKSFSLSARRWNTNEGSMFPDSVMDGRSVAAIVTSDGWMSRQPVTQDYKCAMLNVVLNSTSHHSPQLSYGRATGAYDYLPGQGVKEIPAAGIVLDCESLTAGTLYSIYAHDNAGTLTLEASTTGRVISEGIEVKAGATSRRFVGLIVPIARVGAYVAPIDVMDSRRLAFRGMRKTLGKLCPMATLNSYFYATSRSFQEWNQNYRVHFVCLPESEIQVTGNPRLDDASSHLGVVSFGLDGLTPSPQGFLSEASGGYIQNPTMQFMGQHLSEGLHTLYPMIRSIIGPNTMLCYVANTFQRHQTQILGSISA